MAIAPAFRHKLEVSWAQNPIGLFTFGTSKFGGTDLLAASSWSSTFGGTPYDDMSKDAIDVTIQRGRSSDADDFRAGTITINLRDRVGRYNRKNGASPLAGLLIPDRPLRYTLYDANGVAHSRFYGFIQSIQADLTGRGTATIVAADFIDKLGGPGNPVVTPAAGLTDGQIIGSILDWYQWTDPAMRRLSAGDTIPLSYTRGDGSRSGLALVSELMQAERGIVFVDVNGAVVYIDRRTRFASVAAGSIDRVMTAFPVGTDGKTIGNADAVQRIDMAGNVIGAIQSTSDSASIVKHRQQDIDPVAAPFQTPFLPSDVVALNLPQYRVLRGKDGYLPVYQVPLDIPDIATQLQAMSRDLGDRVTMTIAPHSFAQFTSDFFIEGITEQIQGTSPRYRVSWLVSEVPSPAPFRFGISQMGGPDALYY